MAIITNQNPDYVSRLQGIRLFVNNTFTADDLADSVIENDVYLGSANREVARRVPGWASLTGDDREDIEVAVQKICAAEILISEFDMTQQSNSDLSESIKGSDPAARAAKLRGDADIIVERLNPSSTVSAGGTIFKVVKVGV